MSKGFKGGNTPLQKFTIGGDSSLLTPMNNGRQVYVRLISGYSDDIKLSKVQLEN